MSPRPIKGKCAYQKDWEVLFPWVQQSEGNKYAAKCTLCQTTFNIDSMGKSALMSHSKGEKHKKKEVGAKTSSPLDLWVKKGASTSREAGQDKPLASATSISSDVTNSSDYQIVQSPQIDKLSNPLGTYSRINKFLVNEHVTKAETIWALQTIMSHSSLRGAASCTRLFPMMFPDSEIAKKISLQKDKLSYIIVYGLCPYFKVILDDIICSSKFVVLGFDESHNKIASKQQMDLGVRFWNEEENRVNSRYLTSVFLYKTTANDLFQAIEANVCENTLKKVCQLSMDGPHVNFKVHQLFSDYKQSEPDSPQLLNLGSCGLHTVHNAFKVGMQKTDWDLMGFFRAIFNLFKYSPSRRGEYSRITDSHMFPLEVCAVRWVENAAVARRALLLLPNLNNYVKKVKESHNEPNCSSYSKVCEFVSDKLLGAKIAFFEGICNDIEPFLREFQTDKPMAPFLYDSLFVLVKTAMSRIVKEDVMNKPNIVEKIDILKKTDNLYTYLKLAKDVDLGYGTRAALRKCEGLSQKDILIFRKDCRTALQFFIAKLMEKSPLKYPLTKGITCFNPAYIAKGNTDRELRIALDKINDSNLISTSTIEKADREYKELCLCPVVLDSCKRFSRTETRLDEFWLEILANKNMENLKEVVKLVLTLSHGNASLERGFSVNREMLVENLSENSLIAQRLVYDTVSVTGGIDKMELTPKMLHYVKSAYSRYKEAFEAIKKSENNARKANIEKKKTEEEVKTLLEKKKRLLEETNREVCDIDEQLKKIKKSM